MSTHCGSWASLHLLETRALGRYEFHDLLRHYALERALAEEPAPAREAALRRALGWLCRTAMSASETFAPGRHFWNDPVSATEDFTGQRQALDWFERERPAVVAAVRISQKSGADDLSWRLASSLLAYFVVRPVWDDFAPMYRNALISANRLGDPIAQAATLVGLGHVEMNMGRDDQAITFYRQALTKFRTAGAARQQASVLTLIANCLEYLGHHAEAESTFHEGLALSRETGDHAREAHALSNLAITCTSLGRYEEAVQLSMRCLQIREAQGDQRGQAHTLDNLGDAWLELGEYDKAIASFSDAAAIARTYSDPRNEGVHLGNLARAQLLGGAAASANDTAEQARRLLAGIPDSDADRVRRRIAETFPIRDA